MVRKVGYMPVGEGWPSCYVHPALKLRLVLYVDDFKLAGPRANLKEGWRLLRLHLSIEDAKPIDCTWAVTMTLRWFDTTMAPV